MKKSVKITLISFASVIGLILVALGIVCITFLSSSRLTKIVNKEVPKFITCNFKIDKADLTIVKTFPYVGIDLHNVILLNPMFGCPSDTLLHVKHCTAAINIRELVKNNHIILKKLLLNDGFAYLYIDKNGKQNFDILKTKENKASSSFDYTLDLQKISTQNIRAKYIDKKNQIAAELKGLDLLLKGQWENQSANGKINISTNQLAFNTLDSNNIKINYDRLSLKFKGEVQQMDLVNGDVNLNIKQLLLQLGEDSYLDSADIHLNSDLDLSINDQRIHIKDLLLKLNQYQLNLNGTVHRDTASGNIAMDLQYNTQKWPLKEFLAMIPSAIIGNTLDDIDMDGRIGLAGKIYGHYNDHQLPLITVNADLEKGAFSMKDFPLAFDKINALFNVQMDLNNKTDLTIKRLDCYTGNNHITATGSIKDLLDKMLFNLTVTGDLHLPDFKTFLPETIHHLNGGAQVTLAAQFDYDQLSNARFDQMKAKGVFHFKNLDFLYNDSIKMISPSLFMDIEFPVTQTPYQIGEWAEAKINAEQLSGEMIGLGVFVATGAHLDAFVNDILDSSLTLKLGTTYQFSTLDATLDTINAVLNQPHGTFTMLSSNQMQLDYEGKSLIAHYGSELDAISGELSIKAKTNYDPNGYNTLLQWNPSAILKLKNGKITSSELSLPLELTNVDVNFNMQKCNIQEGSGKFGNSDFTLSGKVLNIDKYFLGQDLLSTNLELVSNYIDLNEIMKAFNGLGAPDSVMAEEPEHKEDNPFMVPYGIDAKMHTLIKNAHYEDVNIRNIGGYLTVKDGILVLDEMGFTSDAARMQLTALYKSPRKNNLFLGLDFHLLDIKIAELINMIPEVDTILPMLKSFAGNAEFHFAAETNLKSNYDLKYSTLRGAAAINGKDLVVLDEDTYHKIAKLLMFKKGTTNKIDSLSAEATIFKKEVDVYPFLVSIDKYQAILSGRHNLDMTYNYNISLVKPIRLGLDIIGTDKRKFKVGKAKYATLFRPEKQKVVEQNVMQLKTQINQSLKANVKEQPSERHQ